MLNQKNLILGISLLFYLLPAALITGPFFSDLIITTMGIFFLIVSLKNKEWIYYNNYFTKFFSLFYIYLLVSSIWAEHTLYSLKSSVPYLRFLLFSLAVVYLSKKNKNLYNSFFKFTFLTLLIVIIDAYAQFLFGKNLFSQEIYNLKDPYTLTFTTRISGLFGDDKKMGSYILRLLPILIYIAVFQFNFTIVVILINDILIHLSVLFIIFIDE